MSERKNIYHCIPRTVFVFFPTSLTLSKMMAVKKRGRIAYISK